MQIVAMRKEVVKNVLLIIQLCALTKSVLKIRTDVLHTAVLQEDITVELREVQGNVVSP